MKKGEAFINFCLSQVGTKYKLGSSGQNGLWDCSGLMSKAAAHIGAYLYHGATTSWRQGIETGDFVEYGDIKDMPLDKVCLLYHADSSKPGTMAHTGAYSPVCNVVQSGGRRGTGTHTNPLYYKDWTKYARLKEFDEEFVDEPKHPTLWGCGRGYWVEKVQSALLMKGYNIGKTGVDGIFGPATLAAVKQFQQDQGLKIDGIVGTNTIKALYSNVPDTVIIEVRNGTEELINKIKSLLVGFDYVVR